MWLLAAASLFALATATEEVEEWRRALNNLKEQEMNAIDLRCVRGDSESCASILRHMHFETREMFFTLNGKMLGKAFDDVECQWAGLIPSWGKESGHQLYPAAALHEEDDRMRFNWGGRPFVFDVAPYLLKSTPIPEADAANEHEVSHLDAEGLAGIPVALMQQLLAMNDDELAEAGIGDAHDIEEGLYESSDEEVVD